MAKKMRAGRGKAKGSAFERAVCKVLSLWMSGGKREDLYWRSAMSGGRATVARKGGRDVKQSGDVTCVHPEGHRLTEDFYLELKHLRDINFDGILTGQGVLVRVWRKTRKEAQHYERHPMLIIKQNRLPVLVCLDRQGLELIDDRKPSKQFLAPRVKAIRVPLHRMVILTLDDILSEGGYPERAQ